MKPLSIADYLDRLGSAAGEKAPPRPEGSPFRPRSLPSPQNGGPGSKPIFDRIANEGGETQGEEAPRRTPWAPKPVSLESGARQSPPAGEPVKPEDMSVKLAEAYARGREEGLAEGRLEASDRHAAELAAARELAETQQQEFRLNEYAELEGAIRSGIKADRGQCRGRCHPHSRAVSLAAGRQARRGRAGQGDCPDLCEQFARVDQDSRIRARACAPAPADRRSADRGRICRG